VALQPLEVHFADGLGDLRGGLRHHLHGAQH
jgi:hypothetical protein